MTEDELQVLVQQAAKAHGLLAYHTFDSRRSMAGFPDLVLVGRYGVRFRELKTAKGRTSPAQDYWIEALAAAGADVAVWRPADWPVRIVAEMKSMGRVEVAPPVLSQAELRRKLRKRAAR